MSIAYVGGNTPYRRAMIFVDGENLVFNYQSTLKSNTNYKTKEQVKHLQDTYVWHPDTFTPSRQEIIRATYYTFAVGDDNYINTVCDQIKDLTFKKSIYSTLPCNLRPEVFKKDKQGKKAKGVDIQMSVDILSNVYNNNVDSVVLVTGDGDFLPIINELIRHGKQVYLASFKSGLNPILKNKVDRLILLDNIYFDF